jgi:hypothetical protein
VSPKPLQTFRNYATGKYKFHIYEIPTGLKLILITPPNKPDYFEKLREIYATIYVPLVSRNMFCQPNHKIHCKLFSEKISDYLASIY